MLKKITQIGWLILLFSCSALLKADQSGYETLSPPQPTHNPDKIEVIEFFWYGCPHCYSFEPILEKWVKSLPANVEFIRQPAVFSDLWGKHAKAYFTAEALGVVDKVHADFFDAVQNKKQKLETEDELAKFFADHGVNEDEFHNAYNSFLVDAKMRQATTMASRYGVTGVPAVIINGKFKTTGPLAGSHEKMIEVMDRLIKQESSAK
ncbi:MAG: thiol:disulfide interchange protein DsbA/DsbL [Methylobacter sp.]|nr:thiol:disulfide interchange protein DsbA/DsbL [Methylobacter sp.]